MSDSTFNKLRCLYTRHWFLSAFLVLIIISLIFTAVDPEDIHYNNTRRTIVGLYFVFHIVVVIVNSDVCEKYFLNKEAEYYGPIWEARKYNESKARPQLSSAPIPDLKLSSSIVAPVAPTL